MDYVLHGDSYANIVLYSSAIPPIKSTEKKDDWDESLDANNPDNFKHHGNKEIYV